MAPFREVRHVAEAAEEADYNQEERRKLVSGALFSEADLGLLAMLKKSLGNETRRAALLDLLESRTEDPLPLRQTINVLERFGSFEAGSREHLTEPDIKLLSFTIKYFENWFYRGQWVSVPEDKASHHQAQEYFTVPAGIVHMLTKIKELPEYDRKLADFDNEKLVGFVGAVNGFARHYLKTGGPSEPGGQAPELQQPPADVVKALEVLKFSSNSVFRQLEKKRQGWQPAADLFFLKTCIIAAESQRRTDAKNSRHIFVPDTQLATQHNEYWRFNFSAGKDRKMLSTMHYPTHRLPFCRFAVEFLRQKNLAGEHKQEK